VADAHQGCGEASAQALAGRRAVLQELVQEPFPFTERRTDVFVTAARPLFYLVPIDHYYSFLSNIID
jgi:hypothetical protein